MTPPGRTEEILDAAGLEAYMIEIRFKERALTCSALTCTNIINWIKRNQREWLNDYLSSKPSGNAYTSLLRLLERFCHCHGFSQQRATKVKQLHDDLLDARDDFAAAFHRKYCDYDSDAIYTTHKVGEL
ncbi:Aste57867_22510 [Aphanomyces stellatus]|uniref:Aste57867_22510 protein n=1 Tax=Aphanomyces stellatus TaxID=120398 RepID=A0A485LKG0_9STRA|nr:hypothetical protein As57867_022440 [Aphanomyces stellatus]VFT99170.1 Aste57867_22510 [Aphanomyces stellatus]